MDIILASASPRRKELLGYFVSDFKCIPADIDETIPSDVSAEKSAEYLACMKAEHIAADYPDDVVIGCDTVVVYGGEVYGKPSSEEDAERMLKTLSGRTHSVITGVCICRGTKKESFSETTEVEFFELSGDEILNYIRSGSPMDKAGAYGIQDGNFLPAKSIRGDYFNVVGLPAGRLKRELDSFLNRQ
ncbi:MAG: Maf family protein [Oscillospiraceae bacterium]|nr:Maf family protein [Oscillospiraceae bacterium]